MKILDKYILKTFLKTFLSIFFILIFIFILQSVWQFVKDLAGKDLDLIIVGKFLVYLLPTLVPLILPLTILLTSIMVFGDFSENYEFAAMKSAGISLQRAMRGLSIFIFFLSITTFFFANNVVPWGAYQSMNLRINIAKLTPAMAIAEGQFNTIGNINIKVDKKSGENKNHLEGVILHQIKRNKITDNYGKNMTVIKAESGDLVSAGESNILQLILYNGNYYNDIFSKDPKKRNRNLHAKSAFKKHTMNIDLSKLNDVDLDKENEKVSHKMLKVSQLRNVIDSLEQKRENELKVDITNTINSLSVFKYTNNNKNIISLPKKQIKKNKLKIKPNPNFKKNKKQEKRQRKLTQLLNSSKTKKLNQKKIPKFKGDHQQLFGLKQQQKIVEFAIMNSISKYKKIESVMRIHERKTAELNQYKMALQTKFSLAFSCFILFFVGAPLGAIIRKGGMGLPMVIAVGLFLSYYFIGIFAQNSAESGAISTFLGAWLSTLILLPLGIMLTRNATSDRGIFNTDGIAVFFERIWSKISRKKKSSNSASKTSTSNKVNKQTSVNTISIIKKTTLLNTINNYNKTSILVLITYVLLIALFPSQQTENSNVILILLTLLYLLFYLITFKKYITLKKSTNSNYTISDICIDFFFGITSYPLAYFYYKTAIKEMKKELKKN